MQTLTIILAFILGIAIGSFLNVCIYRLPLRQSLTSGYSVCPSCGKRLTALDMLPILSCLILGGKCRYCKERISSQYPIVELLTGILYALLVVKFGLSIQLPFYAALLSMLIVITWIDIKHKIIPNGIVIAGLTVGVIQLAISFFSYGLAHWSQYVIGFFAGGLPLLLIALFCTHVLKKDAMGGGDIKLMAFTGLIIGWKLIIPSYFIGIIAAAIFGVIALSAGKKERRDEIPFGPFLSIGIIISIFFGNELIDWYLGLL